MMLLTRIPSPRASLTRVDLDNWYMDMAKYALVASGLKDYMRSSGDWRGYLTIEDTPGYYNNNPQNKLMKVMHYELEPATRRGYYAKFKINELGALEAL